MSASQSLLNGSTSVLVPARTGLITPRRRSAIRPLVVLTVTAAMTTMPAMPKHVHGDEGDRDQNPNPIR